MRSFHYIIILQLFWLLLTRNKNGLSTAFSISSSIGITCPTPIIIRRRRRRRRRIHVSISEQQQTSSLLSSNSFNDLDSNLDDSNDKYKDNTDNSTFIVHHQQQLLHQEERQRQGQKSPITISLFDQSTSSSSSNSSSSLSLNSSSSSSTNSSSSSLSLSDEQQQQQRNHPLLSLNLNLDSLAQVGAGNLAQELLRRIQALYAEGYYQISPDIVSYNSVLKAWKEQDNPQQALELLESMIQEEIEVATRVVVVDDDDDEGATGGDDDDAIKNGTSTNNNISSRPIRVDVISFNTVIAAFANQGNYNKALELLRRMQQYDNDNNNDDVNENDNDRKALELLRRMQQQQGGDDDDVNDNKVKNTNNTNRNKNRTMYHYYPNPDTTTYNIVLYSLAQSDDCGTAEQAENLLREMMTTGLSYVDTTSFNTVLYAWSKEGVSIDNNNNFNSNNNAKKNTKNTKIKNNNNSNSVSKKIAAQRAEDLLTIMEALSEAEGNSHLLPDVYSYTTVIQCWAKCLRPDMAQDVFNQMTIDRGLQPNKLTYTALINALSKSGQPELAEQVLHQMIDSNEDDDDEDNNNENNILPDTVTFSSVIDGWSRVASKDRPEAAARALHILETMKNHAAEGMGPNARTYTSVLTALAKSGTWDACEKAKNLVQYMEEVYNNSTDDTLSSSSSSSSSPGASLPNNNNNNDDKWSMRPTNIHYNCLLNAYARSPQADKGIKAEVIIKEMENHPRLDCRPDTISYNSLLMACAHASGDQAMREKTFQIALRTFRILVSSSNKNDDTGKNNDKNNHIHSLYPTSTTFAHFFRACRKLLLPAQRQTLVTKALKICMELGMLNFLVAHQVQLSCKSELVWREVAGELSEYVDWKADFRRCSKDVPQEWMSNSRR